MFNLVAVVLTLVMAAPVLSQARGPEFGDFYLNTMQDPITDEISYVLLAPEIGEDLSGASATLGIGCAGGETSVGVLYGGMVARSGPRPVIHRFDKRDPGHLEWVVTRGAMSLTSGVEGFIEGALTGSRLVVRVKDDVGEDHTFQFSLVGLTEGLSNTPCATDAGD